MKKIKRIIAVVLALAVAGTGIGAGLMQLRKKSQKSVNVTPVSGLLQEYYMPSTSIDGTVTTSTIQTVNGDKDLIVDQIFAEQGDTVKKGDPLVSFDTTLVNMELNIAKLKKQKQEQDLNKAVNRLNSLLHGGPVEDSDGGATADNLPSYSGDDIQEDSEDSDVIAYAGGLGGYFLSAAYQPLFLSAFNAGDSSDSDNEEETDGENTQETDIDTLFEGPSYTDSSANGFGDGEDKNSFNPGVTEVPQITHAPGLDDHTDYFDPYYKKGDSNLTDGREPFYEKLDSESIPFTGSGTEEDPYIFLCSSARGEVTAMGSFFNKLAGYSPDGTRIVHEGGYWYQLEFHQNDTISDYENRKESCTGYYLINGSLLEKPVYEFSQVEFTLDEASRYEEEVPGDDAPGAGGTDPSAPLSRADAVKFQKSRIASLKLDIQESDIKIGKLEKKAAKTIINSKLDGTVVYVGDPQEDADGNSLVKVKSGDGFFVIGAVSELLLDNIKEGTILNCTSYTSGSFQAEVVDVSEYPVTSNNFYYGDSNPNVSYYAFTAVVTDKSLQLEDQDYVAVNFEQSSSDSGSMVLQKAFVKSENGKNYVYKDVKGRLKKQEIVTGATVDSGYSILVKSGLDQEDLIAFPYGKDVIEGAKTNEVSLDEMYGY
ncbi:MAG: hypothetical protein PUI16_03055 [Clostridia bacterium]|nr:hypothetical protein [Clostridia bacterium]MDY5555234.1 hypothetical protein [Blautia sp.]